PSGFWAAWITNLQREPDKKERAETNDNAEAVDMGPRYVTLLPLDTDGHPAGAPLSIPRRDGHVLGFDLATGKDGVALVAWRDDKTSPATAGGAAPLAVVRAGG